MIIIPARLASTRFEKKILAPIDGVPMVIATAKQVCEIDEVAIATDSLEVLKVVNDYGIKAILTDSSHQSGTDRIFEAAKKLNLNEDEVVLNVQADEPFIEPNVVKMLYDHVYKNRHKDWIMASCYKVLNNQNINDPNLVKVVLSESKKALYFSRATIPYARDGKNRDFFGHLGLYGFNLKSLRKFCNLPQTSLERCEKLEQLRALSHDYAIEMVKVESESIGIDTPEDLIYALKLFSSK